MRPMNCKKVSIKLLDGTIVKGTTNIGNARRLSDYFNKADSLFMVLFDVYGCNADEGGVLFINRSHILWVKPEEDRKRRAGEGDDELCLAVESSGNA